ncbi:gluconate 2-dehydrogenase subunit 3 family protein [Algoriphagus namhaensis]
MSINRRDALKSMVLMMGGAMAGSTAILTGCAPENQIEGLNFSPSDIAFLDEVGDTIIPETDTPGAKATGIGEFMVMMVKDTYDGDQQKAFVSGINTMRSNFKSENGKSFEEASTEERIAYLNKMKSDADADQEAAKVIYMLKDLTVLGYFTSEIGATQALNYIEVPGRYDGCIPLEPGDKAYAL